MKKLFIGFFVFCSIFASAAWHSNYQVALIEAKKNNKKIFLYFSGAEYCPWSKIFYREILVSSSFNEASEKYFECVYVDSAAIKSSNDEQYVYNKKLKDRYEVSELPTVVIIDKEESLISKLGYMPIGVDKYIEKVENIVKNYNVMKNVDSNDLNPYELAAREEKSEGIDDDFMQDETLTEGLNQEKKLHMLFDHYISLIEKNESQRAEVVRKEIKDTDPHNLRKSFFRLAVIDFENLAREEVASNPEEVILPIKNYIKAFGKKDKLNLWKLEMLISQFLSSKGVLKEALKHARASYKAAPIVIRKELAKTIVSLKKRIREEKSLTGKN